MPEDTVTAAAKNIAKALLTTNIVQINEANKQTLTQLSIIFTAMVNSKYPPQKQSHVTKVNIPNIQLLTTPNKPASHLRVQQRTMQKDQRLLGCIEMLNKLNIKKRSIT